MKADHVFMRRALRLAERGWGRVHPNPMVGAVVVANGQVVGEGWHAEFGQSHAEVVALDGAGDRARDATLYVTLEPCAHRGKTLPCTDAILAAGIRRVVCAASDPTEAARGGATRLRDAGIDVRTGIGRRAARRQNAAFFCAHEQSRTFVALKLALSLDARLSERDGERTQLTGAAAMAETHRLRAGFDAIMVGSRTAAIDDPLLTARGSVAPRVPPIRIVLDTEARLDPASHLARGCGPGAVWVLCAGDADRERVTALEALGLRVLGAQRAAAGLDIEQVLSLLWREGVRSVLCEGGGRVAASLLAASGLDRMYLMLSPRVIGPAGPPAFPTFQASESMHDRDPVDAAGEAQEAGVAAAAASYVRALPGWRVILTRTLAPDALVVLDRVAPQRQSGSVGPDLRAGAD